MYYVDDQLVDLAALSPRSPHGGKNYRGDNEVYAAIAHAWQNLHDRFNPEEPIVFVRPHMKSGAGSGSMGGAYDRTVMFTTASGQKQVTWCDTVKKNAFGQPEYLPKKFMHTPEQALTLTLNRHIEQILWHVLFDKLRDRTYSYPAKDITGRPHPLAGKAVSCLYILDPDDDARTFIINEAKRADLNYLIISTMSPLAQDREGLNMLASAWGIYRPETMTDFVLKRELYNAVELAEQQKNTQYGYEAFIKAAQEYIDKGNTYPIEVLATINKAFDRNIIKWMPSKLSIELLGNDGQTIKRICNVPAGKSEKYKEVLADYLIHNEDDLVAIQSSVDAVTIAPKQARKFYIPDNPTRDFFAAMKYPEMSALVHALGHNIMGMRKPKMIDVLVSHFITDGKMLPDEFRLKEPQQ